MARFNLMILLRLRRFGREFHLTLTAFLYGQRQIIMLAREARTEWNGFAARTAGSRAFALARVCLCAWPLVFLFGSSSGFYLETPRRMAAADDAQGQRGWCLGEKSGKVPSRIFDPRVRRDERKDHDKFEQDYCI